MKWIKGVVMNWSTGVVVTWIKSLITVGAILVNSVPASAESVPVEFSGNNIRLNGDFLGWDSGPQGVLDFFFNGVTPAPGQYDLTGSYTIDTDAIGVAPFARDGINSNVFPGAVSEYVIKVNGSEFKGIGTGRINMGIDAAETITIAARIEPAECLAGLNSPCPDFLFQRMQIFNYPHPDKVRADIAVGILPDIASILTEGTFGGELFAAAFIGGGQISSPVSPNLVISKPAYSCEGFYGPASSEIVVRRPNRVIPLRMNLFDGTTEIVDGPAPILQMVYESTSTDFETAVAVDFAGKGDDGNQFVYSDGEWAFNLKTKGLPSGTFTMSVVSASEDYIVSPTCGTLLTVK